MEFPESFVREIIKLALVVITLSASIYLFRLATSAYEASSLNYSIGILILGTIYFVHIPSTRITTIPWLQ